MLICGTNNTQLITLSNTTTAVTMYEQITVTDPAHVRIWQVKFIRKMFAVAVNGDMELARCMTFVENLEHKNTDLIVTHRFL